MKNEPNVECSSEETNTSLSSWENRKNRLSSHVVDFNESKTHLFYLIQSANERNDKTKRLIRIKISKERPTSRKFLSKKMFVRCGNNDDMTDDNQEKTNKTHASIHSRTDHPSFVVLPHVMSRRRVNIRKNIERNQSTSEHSNETYVIRSKEDNKIVGSSWKVPTLSLWNRNSQTTAADFLHGINLNLIAKPKSPDYCECGESNAGKSTNVDMKNLNKNISEAKTSTSKTPHLKKDDLFNIKFVQSSQQDASQRLRAGQDNHRRYKSCSMCPNMTRIFPPASVGRRTAFQYNNSDSGSNSTLKNRKGYVKINFKLIRQCLITAPANEKCKVLDAIRLRMKSPDFNLAMKTIEDIVAFDLFGVQCECRSRPLLEDLLWPINVSSYELQTSIARFVNALVSYKIGRSYFSNKSVIHMFTWGDIGRYNIDPIMGDNLIGIMMKLSCSRFQRSDMIKNGLLRWLLQHMEADEYSMSKYRLQCMAGLLRNLLRGYNLDDLSTIETRKLIVLLGRYLDTENVAAKRYICDSLMTLFRSITHVTSAKELNFQRIIEGHLTRAVIPKQREHLRAVYQLLNRSSTSKSFSIPKFDSPSEDDPYLDTELGSDINGEEDPYLGECLIREKFSVDTETHGNDKNFNETNTATRKDDRLISRVFVEHLNCFLPNIEKNRIFPLCNARCADKIRTCSHLGENHRKKRQHYIPPNSRVSGFTRQQPSYDDSDEAAADYKSMIKHAPTSAEKVITHISTISHDKSAARWDHFHEAASTGSGSTGMERLNPFDSTLEEIIRSESYYPDPSELADMLDDGNDHTIEKKVEVPGERLDLESESNQPGIESETVKGETKKGKPKSVEGFRSTEDEQCSSNTTAVYAKGFTDNDDQLTDDRISISTTPTMNQADSVKIEKMVEVTNVKANENEQKILSTLDDRETTDGLARESTSGDKITKSKTEEFSTADDRKTTGDLARESTSGDKITKSKTEELSTVAGRKTAGDLAREDKKESTSGDVITKSKTEEFSTVAGRKTTGDLAREGNKGFTSGDKITKSKTQELSTVESRKTTDGLAREDKKESTSGDKITKSKTEELSTVESRKSTDGLAREDNKESTSGDKITKSKTEELSTSDDRKTTGDLAREDNKESTSGDVITKSKTEEFSTVDGRKTTGDLGREDKKQSTSGDTKTKSKTEENMEGRQDSPNQKSKHITSDRVLSSQPTPKPTQATLNETKLSQQQVELPSEPISKSELNEYSTIQDDLEAKDNEKLTCHFPENLRQPKMGENKSDRKLPVRSEEVLVSSRTGQHLPTIKSSQPVLKARSDEALKKISPACTSKENQISEVPTSHQLHARSTEALKNRGQIRQSDRSATKLKMKEVGEDLETNKAVKRMSCSRHSLDSSITSQPVKRRLQNDIGNGSKLHARSAENLTKFKVAQSKSPATASQQREIIKDKDDTEMHARSVKILNIATVAEKSTIVKSSQPSVYSEEGRTSERKNELSSASTLKDDMHQLHARSLEVLKHPRKVHETSVRTVTKSKSTIAISKNQSVVVRKEDCLTTTPPTKSKQDEVGRKMQARSTEILSPTAAEKSSTVKSNQPPVFDEVLTSEKNTNLSSVSTAKDNVISDDFRLHARSTRYFQKAPTVDGKSKEMSALDCISEAVGNDNVKTQQLSETSTTLKLTHVQVTSEKIISSGERNDYRLSEEILSFTPKSVDAISTKKDSEPSITELMKSTSETDPQIRQFPDELDIQTLDSSQSVGQSVVDIEADRLTSTSHTKSKPDKIGTAGEKSSPVKIKQESHTAKEIQTSAKITNLSSVSAARSTEVLKHTKNVHEARTMRKSKSTIEISRNPGASVAVDDSLPVDGKSKEIAAVGGMKTNERSYGVSSIAEDNEKTKRPPETLTNDHQGPAPIGIAGDLQVTSGKIIPNLKTDEKSRNIRSGDDESEEISSPKNVKLPSGTTGKESAINEVSLIQQSKSKEGSEPSTTKLIKSASETDPQSQHQLPEQYNPSQSVGGRNTDHSISSTRTKSKQLNVVQDDDKGEVETEMTSKMSTSQETKKTNHKLLKSSSDRALGSFKVDDITLGQTDSMDSVDENKLIHQLPARSEELVIFKQKSRHSSVIHATQSTTAIKGLKNSRHNTGFISGDSSKSSINKSQDCVDCEGNGYVLRARPSHPCDRCKVSLSTYPRFVDALTEGVSPSDDAQHRIVTRTTDDSIKVHWVSKTIENQISEPNQEKSKDDKFDESNMDGKAAETKTEAEQNTSSLNVMSSSTENFGNKTKEKLNFSKDVLNEVNTTSRSEDDVRVMCSEQQSLLPTETKSEDLANSSKRSNTTGGSLSEKLREEQISNSRTTDDVNVTSTKYIEGQLIIFGQKSVVIDDDYVGQHSKPSTTVGSNKLLQTTSEHEKIGSQKIVSKDVGNLNALTGRLQPNECQSTQDEIALEEHCEEIGSIQIKGALPKEQTKSLRKNTEGGVDSGEKISKLVKGDELYNEAITTAAAGMKSDTTVNMKGISTKTTVKVRLEGSTAAMRIGGIESSPEMSFETPLAANDRIANNNLSENDGKLNVSPNSMSTSTDNQVRSSISHQQLSMPIVSQSQLNELGNEMNSNINKFNKINTCENISVSKQPKMVQSKENFTKRNHTENVDSTAQTKVSESEAEQKASMNKSTPKQINASATPDDRQLLAARSMDNVNTIFISQSESLKKQTESERNNNEPVAAGGSDDQVFTPRSICNIRIEYAGSQSFHNPLGRSLKMRQRNVFAGDDASRSATQGYERSLEKSLKNKNEADVGGTHSEVLATRSVDNVRSEITAPKDYRNELSNNFEESVASGGTGDLVDNGVFDQRPDDARIIAPHSNQTPLDESFTNTTKSAATEVKDYHQSSSPTQQNNQTPSEPLKNLKQDGRSKQQVLAAKVRGEKADQSTLVMTNLLLARSMEMVPEKRPVNKLKDVKSEYQTRRECDGYMMNETKSICNKTSTVSDEVQIKQTNYLNLDGETAAHHTETNRELSHVSSDDRKVQGGREVQVVNSTCCRQLLNDEELINRLSEKVLKKLFTEIHCCGPNCKSRCGGRNSYFKAQKDNNRNSE